MIETTGDGKIGFRGCLSRRLFCVDSPNLFFTFWWASCYLTRWQQVLQRNRQEHVFRRHGIDQHFGDLAECLLGQRGGAQLLGITFRCSRNSAANACTELSSRLQWEAAGAT